MSEPRFTRPALWEDESGRHNDSTKHLQLRLYSPAFLGDAHQSGVWRTPPIKALLREWWRVAAAPESGYDHRSLRVTEGLSFTRALFLRIKRVSVSWEDGYGRQQLRYAAIVQRPA